MIWGFEDYYGEWAFEDYEPIFHRGCGGLVTVKHYPAILYAYDGPSPPETYIRCAKCGDIGDDEVSECPQEPCEACGKVLTDCGETCKRCRVAEEEGGAKGAESGKVAGSGAGREAVADAVRR